MRKYLKQGFVLCMALMLALGAMSAAFAAGGSGENTPGSGANGGEFEVTGYRIEKINGAVIKDERLITINKGDNIDILLNLKYNTAETTFTSVDVARRVDSFSGGTAKVVQDSGQMSGSYVFQVRVTNLKYRGSGKTLSLLLSNKGNAYQNLDVPISECKEYTEPTVEPTPTPTPDPIPTPKVIVTRNELSGDVKAGDELMLTVSVKNIGRTTINNPILSFTPSESLLVVGKDSAVQMNSIGVGRTETAQVKVRVLDPVASVNQYLDAKLEFTYYNNVSTTAGEASARIGIPAKVKKKTEETTDETTASPLPNIIVSRFHYGGGSVAAGSKFNLAFKFRNTSSTVDVENMVITVTGGEGLTINGSSNTFFYDKVKAGASKTVTVPMKVANTTVDTAQDVSINFKYEYLDHKKRTSASSDVKISVPLYQPDRFEISNPVVPDYVEAGQEVAVTMNYINKSKVIMSNVEAVVDGDVSTQTPIQTIGNVDAGKNGTIAFALTPNSTGEVDFAITVNYEDANGESKTRIFPVTMNVQEAAPYDPGTDDPGMDDPGEETGGFPWWIVIVAVAAIGIAALIVLKKRKKAKAAKKEQELWDSWDDEMKTSSDSGSAAADSSKETSNHKEG